MQKYIINFGIKNKKEPITDIQKLSYIDNHNNKKVKHLKDFISCYNDDLCICMLKLFNIKPGYINNDYLDYDGENNEDELELKSIHCNNQIAIFKVKNKCDCGFWEKNNGIIKQTKREILESSLKQKENIYALTKKIDNLEKKEEWTFSERRDFANFYDIVIDIDSILKLKKGWNIEISEEGFRKYTEFKDIDLIKIGTVGNMNKGKSFILSKLSKIKLPAGTSISTKGISVKYPRLEEVKSRKYILLDSAGFESPILRHDDDDEIYKIEKEARNDYEKQQNMFREKAKDILITESFLQNFIIVTSDILLLIIDNLSYSEQKLINKIKGEIKRIRKEKKLFIIHNLKTYRSRDQVQNYINNTLLKSGTFSLQKHEHITSEATKVIEGEHFTEPVQNFIKAYHLIFAADDSEAGNIYNNYTIDFIEKKVNDVIGVKNFDVIEEIRDKFSFNCKKYLNEKITKDDFLSNEEIMEKKIFQLKEEKEITLKRCFIDEIGIQKFKGSGFDPQYNFFKNGDLLEIRVELPGNVKPNISKPMFIQENTIISITGKKNRDKDPKNFEDNIDNTRDFGDFSLEIAFRTEDYKIRPEIKDQKLKNGLLLLQYDIEDDKSEEKMTSLTVDEEI